MTAMPAAASLDAQIASLTPSLRALALRGMMRNFKKNTIIIHEGDVGDTLFIVLKGSVKAFSTDQSGREITYGTIGEGDYFGEMSLDGGPRSASVMTLEPTTCALITRAAVRDHVAEEPEFALELMAQVIRRARLATETARNIALLDVYGRVIATLEGEHGTGKPEAPILIAPITHQSLASRVGASREMVSRLLKDLERGGYVELGVKRITLKKKLPARW
ncbi:MAG TPA: Crp/Fnr family transcriptional regulator [Ramlibacter sp.]|uniref:Crp/Fnr family transcriptional regulator n=1 Tax=Ramlibacter sp. TaxID=1917967 RepID=UPI002C1A4943|nr:Crp/Fnr family transcriptional regulator [Ramlibacter sp.]HVZ44097.1 Crp/Fnr family transcriptional regulator [Ramlibacter sp.]